MGWNKVNTQDNKIFKDIKNDTRFYFATLSLEPSNQEMIVNYTKYKKYVLRLIIKIFTSSISS